MPCEPWQLVQDWLRSVDERAGRDPDAPGSWWNRHVERVDRARGVKSLYLRNGGAYLVRSHRRAARGLRAHCVMVDEAREWRGEEAFSAWGAIVGTQAGLGLGRDTQLVVASNAGDDDSLVLNMLRDTGRAAATSALTFCSISDAKSALMCSSSKSMRARSGCMLPPVT